MKTNNKGFTLVELLVVMALSMVLLGVTISIFFSSNKNRRVQESLASVQDATRLATYILKTDIQMASYAGCSDTVTVFNTVTGYNGPSGGGLENPIEGWDGSKWLPSGDTAIAGSGVTVVSNTDAIKLRYLRGDRGSDLASSVANGSKNLTLKSVQGLKKDQIVALSSCETLTVFRIESVNQSDKSIVSTVAMPVEYSSGTFSSVTGFIYFLGQDASGVQSLYRQGTEAGASSAPEVVLRNVEAFSLTYGVDQDGDNLADKYVPASSVSNSEWSDSVVAVRFGLLVRSENDALDVDDTKRYAVNSIVKDYSSGTNGGKFVRKAINHTVQIRNKKAGFGG